jgi:hypothetical protein
LVNRGSLRSTIGLTPTLAGMTDLAENRPEGGKAHFQWIHKHADAQSIYSDCAEGELKRLEERRSKQ